MDEKRCKQCSKTKPLTEYYKYGKYYGGKCKVCTKAYVKKNRLDNIEYYRKYDRNRPNKDERAEKFKEAEKERLQDPEIRKQRNAYKKKWQENNTVKRAAHIIVGNAIRDGRLIKQPCEICGEAKVEAHHPDYSKPLEVNWLCRKCHAEHHKKESRHEPLR